MGICPQSRSGVRYLLQKLGVQAGSPELFLADGLRRDSELRWTEVSEGRSASLSLAAASWKALASCCILANWSAMAWMAAAWLSAGRETRAAYQGPWKQVVVGCSLAGKGQASSSGAGWLPSQLEQRSRTMTRDSYRCRDKKQKPGYC